MTSAVFALFVPVAVPAQVSVAGAKGPESFCHILAIAALSGFVFGYGVRLLLRNLDQRIRSRDQSD